MNTYRTALLIAVAGFAAGADTADEFPFFRPVQPPRGVQVMAHRGSHDRAPENTMASLEGSIADSVDWVEVDVQLARDGRHLVIHDTTLQRTTDGSGAVAERTAAELKSLDAGSRFARRMAGERVPTLAEYLSVAKDRVNLYLDCKRIDPAQLARDLIHAGMERQAVVVAPIDVLRSVRNVPGGDRIALMPKWKTADGLAAFHDGLKPAAVEIQAEDVSAECCRAFHARGLKVLAVALKQNDKPEVWDRVIDAGADWVQSDRAEEILARESLKRLGPARDRVQVTHHRQASRYAPENTLAALEKSIRLGADRIDVDVQTCRDGIPVVLHDATLDRTTRLRGPVLARDSVEVIAQDAGAWFGQPYVGEKIPTLDAYLRAAGDRAALYLDAKNVIAERLVEVIRSHNLVDRILVHAKPEVLAQLHRLDPKLRLVPGLSGPAELDDLITRIEPYAIDAELDVLTRGVVDRCHARGVKVFTHGTDESTETYLRAIRGGIDAIQTDYPVRVLRALELAGFPKGRPATSTR
jgi:glycerophosphoryl diester phosphodiesterase